MLLKFVLIIPPYKKNNATAEYLKAQSEYGTNFSQYLLITGIFFFYIVCFH